MSHRPRDDHDPAGAQAAPDEPGRRPARRARVCEDVFEAIGDTPLVRIQKYIGAGPRTYVKLEAMNPGGSSKDRSAREMLLAEERAGRLRPGATVIVSTSGNMGIALAMLCARRGYELVAIVDPKISAINLQMLRVYGARVVQVVERDEHGSYLAARLRQAESLRRRRPDAVNLDQYDT